MSTPLQWWVWLLLLFLGAWSAGYIIYVLIEDVVRDWWERL